MDVLEVVLGCGGLKLKVVRVICSLLHFTYLGHFQSRQKCKKASKFVLSGVLFIMGPDQLERFFQYFPFKGVYFGKNK